MKILAPLLSWFAVARWRLSLSHVLLAVPFFIIGTKVFSDPQAGAWTVAIAFFIREVVQYQNRVKVPGASNITVALEGYNPFKWGFWSCMDFALPTACAKLAANYYDTLFQFLPMVNAWTR